MDLKKNDIVTLEITGTTSEGSGVGKYNNTAIFVPATAEGDKAEVIIVKTAKTYAFGKVKSILKPSPDRVESDCAVSAPCGGCVFRHISYEAELRIKKKRVEDAIRRIGGFKELEVEKIVGAENPDGYRNKTQLPVRASREGGLDIGFFAPRSHRVISCTDCKLQPKEFSFIAERFIGWMNKRGITPYDEQTHSGTVRHLYIRKGFASGEIMVCVVINSDSLDRAQELVDELTAEFSQIKSIVLNINKEKTNVILGNTCKTLYGKPYINDTLCGLRFKISPLSFYQVNHDQAERLYSLAADFAALTGEETLLDLYCGTGTIGLSMASKAKKLIGVEIVPQAIEDAKINAQENGIDNARFICGDAAKAAEVLRTEGIQPDVIVLDPPRKGCAPELLKTIVKISPERIVYVSCDCATLARDMKLLAEDGYEPQRVVAVDMFPRTAHCEVVVQLRNDINS